MHPKLLVALQELHRDPPAWVYTQCGVCGQLFTDENVHTAAGWRETQISGDCENCFDELFDDDEGVEEELQNLQDAYEVLPPT